MYFVDYSNKIVRFPIYEFVDSFESDVDFSINTILWGKLPVYSNIIGDLMFREESTTWETLFLKRSRDFLKPVNFFNNSANKDRRLCLVREAEANESVKEFFTKRIRHRPNFLDFLDLYHRIAVEENIYYEMFQKSFFFEIFFHLLKKESVVSKPIFLAVARKYMGLDSNEVFLDDVFEFYSRKYAYQIIPRRHGKTFMTGSAFCALLFTYLPKGLRLGYYSHTKDLAQSVKDFVISKSKELSTKLSQSRYSIKTPSDSVIVKIMSDQTGEMLSNKRDDEYNCVAKFKSARNDNALRGDDLNILIVDEAFCINKNRFGTILAHGQKQDNMIVCLTSPVNHKVEEMCEITRGLRCRDDINFYHVYYFCSKTDHLKFASKFPACPRLMFYKPDHINIDETNRFLTNLLARSNTSYEDELGIVPALHSAEKLATVKFCPFSDRFLTYMRYNVNIIDDAASVENVFIYVDPNYCDSLTSGIGVLASGLTREGTACVLYLDHKFIESEELGKVNEIIVRMILDCIRHLNRAVSTKRTREGNHKTVDRKFFIAVENNCQRSNCVAIYDKVKQCFRNSDIKVYLYSTPVENKITKVLNKRAGYSLLNKFTIFSQTIQFINENFLWFSNLLHSHHLNKSGKNEIEYLTRNMTDFKFFPQEKKFTGKSTNSSDDLVVALVMSIFLARSYTSCVKNSSWLSMSCWELVSSQ